MIEDSSSDLTIDFSEEFELSLYVFDDLSVEGGKDECILLFEGGVEW